MKKLWLILSPLFLMLILSACGSSRGTVTVSEPWARSSPQGAEMSAMYFSINNDSSQADVLTGVSASIAKKTELHRTVKVGDAMKMEPIPNQKLDIPSGGTVDFAPGGYHVMLMGLSSPLTANDSFEATLHFEKAGDITVTVPIKD